jgi:hypothetical protein
VTFEDNLAHLDWHSPAWDIPVEEDGKGTTFAERLRQIDECHELLERIDNLIAGTVGLTTEDD